jgi:hypothetical protein
VKISKGFSELKQCAYTAAIGEPPLDFRHSPSDKSNMAKYLFGGFQKCLYPLQKFQSDSERKLAVILERESSKWFKPAKGQFQIYYKSGADQLEYQPDFVAETDRTLSRIFSALRSHRGFDSFIRSKKLPNCDFLVFAPEPGFVVEFDESQHFTRCRELALASYPASLRLGFDRAEWTNKCRLLSATDNDPPFRDEQRAWYDTLRDFLPLTLGMLPTIRLYAREFAWCHLSPDRQADVETFAHIIGERASFWALRFRTPSTARLARIAFDGPWAGDIGLARTLLADVCARWPSGIHVTALATCGAFLRFDWPTSMPRQRDNRFPDEDAVRELDRIARGHCEALLRGGLRQKLSRCADYLTIGIDSRKAKVSSTQNYIPEDHAELVYVVDLQSGAFHFTGKSYPTPNQARGLLRIADIDTHFTVLNGQTVMVLGCHDLTIFNPRSDAKAKGWRADVKSKFKKMASRRRPAIVLHHPHTTVKRKTWLVAWQALLRHLPSVKSHLGTGCYSLRDPVNGLNRDPQDAVLDSTKSADVLDIVVQLGRIESCGC